MRMMRVSVHLIVVYLMLLSNSRVHSEGNLICTVIMDTPEWYQPEYDIGGIWVDMQLRFRTPNSDVTHYDIRMTMSYGGRTPPKSPSIATQIDRDEDDNEHTFSVGFNGSHVCVAVNYVQVTSSGQSERCESQCHRVFDPDDTMTEFEYFSDNRTDHFRSAYLVLNITESAIRKRECYGHGANPIDRDWLDCSISDHCLMTTTQKKAGDKFVFNAGCSPQQIDCSKPVDCQTNIEASHVGDGSFNKVCNYCCRYTYCNDVTKCNTVDGTCSFYGPPRIVNATTDTPGESPGGGTITLFCGYTLYITFFVYLTY